MFTKLNMKGVSHHFLLPIMAVLVIAGIGGYVMQRSSSAMTDGGSSNVSRTVKATVNGAGKTCKQRTYMLNAKSTCVTYAQQAMGITADGVFGKNTRAALKSKTGSTTLNSASWSTLCSKIKSKNPVLYGKAGCNGKSYTYTTKVKKTSTGGTYSYCVKYTYKAPSKDSAGVPKSEPKVSCTKNNFSTEAAGKNARETARKATAYKNYKNDLAKYNKAKEAAAYAKTAYEIKIVSRGEYPNRTKVSTTTHKNVSKATLQKYNDANDKVRNIQNADDKRYNLTWDYLTSSMSESTLYQRCAGLNGTVKSKFLTPNSKYQVHSTVAANHKICGN